jgi:hypothetical protein
VKFNGNMPKAPKTPKTPRSCKTPVAPKTPKSGKTSVASKTPEVLKMQEAPKTPKSPKTPESLTVSDFFHMSDEEKKAVFNSVGPNPLSAEDQSILADWIHVVLKGNTRFDQRSPTTEHPAPVIFEGMKALFIVAFIEQEILKDPSILDQFKPSADGVHRHPKPGDPWHVWECACLVEEVAELQRAGGYDSKATGVNMFRYLSARLNERYGVDRSENSVKNTWYRELRARSGIDERAAFRSPGKNTARLSDSMRVSLTSRGGGGMGSAKRRGAVGKTPTKKSSPKTKKSSLKMLAKESSLEMLVKENSPEIPTKESSPKTPVKKDSLKITVKESPTEESSPTTPVKKSRSMTPTEEITGYIWTIKGYSITVTPKTSPSSSPN